MTAPADMKLPDPTYSELLQGSSIEQSGSAPPTTFLSFNPVVGAPVHPIMPSSSQPGKDQSVSVHLPSPDPALNPAYGRGEQAEASRLWLHTTMRERQHINNDVPDKPDQAKVGDKKRQRKSIRKQILTNVPWRPTVMEALAVLSASQNPSGAAPLAGTTQAMSSSQSQRSVTAARKANTTQVMNPSPAQKVVTDVSAASRTKRKHSTTKKVRWEVPETIHEEPLSNER